MLLVYLLPIFP